MPKRILIARHANASLGGSNRVDFERPLNERGLRDASEMGERLVQYQCIPQWVLASSATRAQQTADLMVKSFGGEEKIQLEYLDEFYHAAASVYLGRLADLPDSFDGLAMVVGHNPGLEQLINQLSDRFVSVPTCTVALVQFDTARWSSISLGNGKLESVWTPE